MDKQLDPAVQERIRALCKRITVAHDLDPEIQEELYGHMEDKLLAYLAGEEKLSPDDAFILVREHFGGPEALREILQAVHESEVRVSLPRRLAAALVATTVISIPVGLLHKMTMIILWLCATHLNGLQALNSLFFNAGLLIHMAPPLISSLLLWWLLVRWQARLVQGQNLWFARWPAHYMWAAAGAALIVQLLIPKVVVNPFVVAPPIVPGLDVASAVVFMLIGLGIGSIKGLAWLWWADRTPCADRRLRWALLGLMLLAVFSAFYPSLVPGMTISHGELPARGAVQVLGEGAIFGTQMHWTVLWAEESLAIAEKDAFQQTLLAVQALLLLRAVTPAILAYGAYLFGRSIHRWTTKRHTHREVIA